MNSQSEQIGELAKALSIAQGIIRGAVEDKKGNFGKHATLTGVWDACRFALSSNNLSVTQDFEVVNDKNIMITTLMHSSGQWKRGGLLMPVISPKVHDLMSSITYCRRYCLCSMLGIAPIDEDDDGQRANDSLNQPKESRHMQRPAEPPAPMNMSIASSIQPIAIDHSTVRLQKAVCATGYLIGEDDVTKFLEYLVEKYPKKTRADLIVSALASDEKVVQFSTSMREWKDRPAS